jgi:ATP-dependent protease ClpP protease subunit
MPKKITIRGFIGFDDNATPEFLEKELQSANGGEIALEIASGGGLVFAGLEMANMIRNYSGRVVARVTGLSASMASYIPMMADEMIVEDNAVFMVHNVSTFAWGDFRDLAKAAKHIEGLRDVLAKAYVNKTGKSLSDVQALMDDETFYYGDEIVEAGFADSVIEVSDDGDDKDTAVILAMEEVASINAKMKENESALKEDWKRAAAYLSATDLKVNTPEATSDIIPPAAAGKPNKEASIMNLKELLAANPEAKTEYEGAITAAADTARAEGETAGTKKGIEQMKTAFTAALPILSSDSYPDTVKERVTAKAMAGDTEGLADFVAMHDMNLENTATATATEEEGEETPGQHDDTKISEDGMINNAADLDAASAQFKKEFGIGGDK